MSSTSTKVSESYNKKKTAIKGQFEETGVKRLIRERAAAAVERASKKTQEDVVKSLADIKVKTTAVLDSISSTLSSEIATLKDVQEAIKAEEDKLKTIHGITVEADSFQAIVLAQKDEKESFHAEMAHERQLWKDEQVQQSKQRQRDEEQYQYETRKRHQEEEDEIHTQRLQSQQAFQAILDAKTKDLDTREELISENENEFKALKEQVTKFDETLKKEISATVAIATNGLRKDLNHESKIKELELNNTVTLKTNEITQLNNRIAELVKQNQALDTEYKAASAKVQQIAEKAIDGAARQQTVLQLPNADSANERARK